jgi:hypothetical protein
MKDIDDIIDQFVEDIDFDVLCAWANILEVEVNYPPLDDMWPDWENELRTEVGDAMRQIGFDTCPICGEEKKVTDLHRNYGK